MNKEFQHKGAQGALICLTNNSEDENVLSCFMASESGLHRHLCFIRLLVCDYWTHYFLLTWGLLLFLSLAHFWCPHGLYVQRVKGRPACL
jgi:hypothetical protein